MRWNQVWESEKRMESVTLDDLKRVARLYLRVSGMVSLALQGQPGEL